VPLDAHNIAAAFLLLSSADSFVNYQVAVSLRYEHHHNILDLHSQELFDKLWFMKVPERYRVMSVQELGVYLGYTTSTVYTHVSRERWDKIPQPSLRLGCGPVWYVGDVEEWRKKNR